MSVDLILNSTAKTVATCCALAATAAAPLMLRRPSVLKMLSSAPPLLPEELLCALFRPRSGHSELET